jgi:hypothetical protein
MDLCCVDICGRFGSQCNRWRVEVCIWAVWRIGLCQNTCWQRLWVCPVYPQVRVKFHRLLEFDKNVHGSANKDHLRSSVSIHNLISPMCSCIYMDLVSALNCRPSFVRTAVIICNELSASIWSLNKVLCFYLTDLLKYELLVHSR